MLTPQEVSERAFAKASFGGYNMAQVDEFLDLVTQDYSSLYNENAVLKSKLKVLADKVEEYRSTEDAMRRALMSAQRIADEQVKEAEQKKAAIIREAEGEALRRKGELTRELEAEEYRLAQARKSTQSFVDQVRALYAGQEAFLNGLQDLCPAPAAPVDPVEAAAEEIDDNVQRLLAQAMKEAAAEHQRETAVAEAQEAPQSDLDDTAEFGPIPQELPAEEEPIRGSRIDFGTLRFGRDYEIK